MVIVVSVAVVIVVAIVVRIPMIIAMVVMTVPMPIVVIVVSIAVVVVIFVLAVMIPVVVPAFFASIIAPEAFLPTTVSVPVRTLAPLRKRTAVAVVRIEGVIHISTKTIGPVKPGPGADEQAIREPLRAVITKGRTGIRRIVEVSIRTTGLGPYLDNDVQLGFCR